MPVPIDAEVDSHAQIGESVNVVVYDTADGCVVTAETHGTREVVRKVASYRTSIVIGTGLAIIDLRCRGVTVVVVGVILVAGKCLLTMDIGIEVSHVVGIAMTESCGRKAESIVIDDHRTEDDLIASVPIDVGNGVVMIALSVPRTGRVAIPAPTLHELVGSRIDIEGNELMTRVDTTTQEDAGLLAIEIGCAEEVLRTAVAITIAPSILDEVVVSRTAEKMTRVLALLETRQRIVDALIGLSSLSIDIKQELGTAVHKPVGTAAWSMH